MILWNIIIIIIIIGEVVNCEQVGYLEFYLLVLPQINKIHGFTSIELRIKRQRNRKWSTYNILWCFCLMCSVPVIIITSLKVMKLLSIFFVLKELSISRSVNIWWTNFKVIVRDFLVASFYIYSFFNNFPIKYSLLLRNSCESIQICVRLGYSTVVQNQIKRKIYKSKFAVEPFKQLIWFTTSSNECNSISFPTSFHLWKRRWTGWKYNQISIFII